MKIFIILNLFVSLCFANQKELDSAINYIKSVITKESTNSLKTEGCKTQKEKWIALFLSQKSFTETFKYNKKCDLSGSFRPQMNEYFNVPLSIKDERFKSINFNSKLTMSFKGNMSLNINIVKGVLKDHKNKVFSFEANQSLILDPLNTKEPIKKSKIGSLTVSHKDAKKTIKI